ncbi:unnamed protein product [Acanthoscelides obtectus]|uniref:Mab-21-like HhH/H2TH-like domain-containing protein n=1 Tax=Acanthoscelides obtectus TaxID=200917 RepID=A0A9P0K8V5_ACAOB|nr:unnamed protein product [Acanthoscelides obtectus]CAK1626793.1 hypothetical protein AOBTE_LOCUS4080 [Acanthoscelides obtectus]
MIKEIQRMPCGLVPKGYWRKNSQHKYPNLEWEIAFPKIEKYLFTKMSHTQIRCYLFLLLIHRIHIEPKTKYQGLLVDHIRHHIFWECWKNFKDWPEHRLGYKLKEIIENLMSRISKNNLPDFFVKGKNLFYNVPIKFLYIASEELQNILERPAMRLIRILESLSFSPHFYKELNVRKLKRMLYLTGLELATTQLPVPMRNDDLDKLQKFNNPETRVEYIKLQKRRHAKAQKLQRTGQRRIEDDGESESKWPCKKYFNEDKIKISHILLFFADRFISLATYSSLRSTVKQTRFFLRQAWYLTKIKDGLGTAHSQKEFEDLQGIIEEMEEELYKKELARKSVGLSPEMRLGGSRKLHQEVDDAGEASICLDIDEEVEIRAKAGRRIYIPKKNFVLRQEVSGVVDDVSGVSYGQVEKREKLGRKNNTGKSVSFLEPQIDDFLEADA